MAIADLSVRNQMGKDMNLRTLLTAGAALLMASGAFAANESTAPQPGEPRSDSAPQVSGDPYTGFNKQVQEKLRALGFYNGPVNGDFGPNTQAALAQFQLSVPLPASGSLDDETLAALGVQPIAGASAGASGDSSK